MKPNAKYSSEEKKIELLNGAILNGAKAISGVRLEVDGGTSDGYHTFDELYEHRMILFSVITNMFPHRSWKSWKHHDGTMYDDYFIVGITTDEGDYTYHYHKDHWDLFKVEEFTLAPEWDGHEPKDITRLLSL